MKKTLVALAALSAISAFAQTSVVIDGYFDRAYTSVSNSNGTKDLKSISSSAGTTTFGVKVREDIGNGFSVGGSVNTDWADIGGATQANANGTAQTGGFANSQSFVDATSAQYGTLRLGTPNSFTLTNATAVAAPAYSTGIGSAYSSSFSIANGIGTGTVGYGGTAILATASSSAAVTGARAIRIANTVQYSSPVVLGGLTAHLGYTPKNDNLTANSGNGNTVGVNEYALRYTNGPIDAMYTSIKYTVGSNGTSEIFVNTATGAGVFDTKTLAGNLTSTQNLLGATYAVLPSLKLHAGFGTFSSSNDASKGKSTQYGATYTTGAWDISGQIAKVDDQSTTDYDRSLKGFGVNYNFSKTARAYLRADRINYATNNTGYAGDFQKRMALGVSKSF